MTMFQPHVSAALERPKTTTYSYTTVMAAHHDHTSWYVWTHSMVTVPVLLSLRLTMSTGWSTPIYCRFLTAVHGTMLDGIRWVSLNKLYFFCINTLGMAMKELELAPMLLNTM
jgi:hypothetical protein